MGANLIEAVGNMPFNLGYQIKDQVQSRERIETHIEKQNLEREHRRLHAAQEKAEVRAEINTYKYDRFLQQQEKFQEGMLVDIKV